MSENINRDLTVHNAEDGDIQLTYSEIIRATDNDEKWFVSVIEEAIIEVDGEPQQATYSGYQLARVRRAQRICRDFEASAPAAALILDLLDELENFRKQRF